MQIQQKFVGDDRSRNTTSYPVSSRSLSWKIGSMPQTMQSEWLDEGGFRNLKQLPKWLQAQTGSQEAINVDLVRRLRQSENWREEADDWAHEEFRKWLQGNSSYNNAALKTNVMRVANDQMKIDGDRTAANLQTPGFSLNRPLSVSATPWGDKSLTGLAGVKDYLRQNFKTHMQREFDYGKLYYFGPQDVEEAWHYFKRFCLNDVDDDISNRHFGPPHNGQESAKIHNRYPGDVPVEGRGGGAAPRGLSTIKQEDEVSQELENTKKQLQDALDAMKQQQAQFAAAQDANAQALSAQEALRAQREQQLAAAAAQREQQLAAAAVQQAATDDELQLAAQRLSTANTRLVEQEAERRIERDQLQQEIATRARTIAELQQAQQMNLTQAQQALSEQRAVSAAEIAAAREEIAQLNELVNEQAAQAQELREKSAEIQRTREGLENAFLVVKEEKERIRADADRTQQQARIRMRQLEQLERDARREADEARRQGTTVAGELTSQLEQAQTDQMVLRNQVDEATRQSAARLALAEQREAQLQQERTAMDAERTRLNQRIAALQESESLARKRLRNIRGNPRGARRARSFKAMQKQTRQLAKIARRRRLAVSQVNEAMLSDASDMEEEGLLPAIYDRDSTRTVSLYDAGSSGTTPLLVANARPTVLPRAYEPGESGYVSSTSGELSSLDAASSRTITLAGENARPTVMPRQIEEDESGYVASTSRGTSLIRRGFSNATSSQTSRRTTQSATPFAALTNVRPRAAESGESDYVSSESGQTTQLL